MISMKHLAAELSDLVVGTVTHCIGKPSAVRGLAIAQAASTCTGTPLRAALPDT